MLGNPKCFKRRKYTGWGLNPVTWQGWVYIGVLISIVAFTVAIMTRIELNLPTQMGILIALLTVILINSINIVLRMDLDEREKAHESLAERNSAWVMVIVLGLGILFQSISSVIKGDIIIDPFLIAALIIGVLTKALSNWYYIDK